MFVLICLLVGILAGSDINWEADDDWFGNSVDISGDGIMVAVSAPGNDDNGGKSGRVRIIELKNNLWTQMGNHIEG